MPFMGHALGVSKGSFWSLPRLASVPASAATGAGALRAEGVNRLGWE
jgi:hypothetical protein